MENNNDELSKIVNSVSTNQENNQENNQETTPVTNNLETTPEISKEEEIGFHKGALNTLVAERNEIVKMIQNIEAIMQAHLKRLEELGVEIPVQQKA